MKWTGDALYRFDERFKGDRNATDVLRAGLTAQRIATRDGRDHVLPEDVDRAIEICWR